MPVDYRTKDGMQVGNPSNPDLALKERRDRATVEMMQDNALAAGLRPHVTGDVLTIVTKPEGYETFTCSWVSQRHITDNLRLGYVVVPGKDWQKWGRARHEVDKEMNCIRLNGTAGESILMVAPAIVREMREVNAALSSRLQLRGPTDSLREAMEQQTPGMDHLYQRFEKENELHRAGATMRLPVKDIDPGQAPEGYDDDAPQSFSPAAPSLV